MDTGAARAPRRNVRVRRAVLATRHPRRRGPLFGVYAILEGVLVVLIMYDLVTFMKQIGLSD